MWTTIISAVISVVTWLVDRSGKAKLNTARYVDYVKKWLEKTPIASDIADDHDALMSTELEEIEKSKEKK